MLDGNGSQRAGATEVEVAAEKERVEEAAAAAVTTFVGCEGPNAATRSAQEARSAQRSAGMVGKYSCITSHSEGEEGSTAEGSPRRSARTSDDPCAPPQRANHPMKRSEATNRETNDPSSQLSLHRALH